MADTPSNGTTMATAGEAVVTAEDEQMDGDPNFTSFEDNNGVNETGAKEGENQYEEIDEDNKSDTEQPIPLSLDQLITENGRLQGVFKNLVNRQTILEEFIEVEHGEKFDSFVQKRERLVNVMGLDKHTEDDTNGKRSSKSQELVNLLKVVRERAEFCNQGSSSAAASGRPNVSTYQSPQKRPPPAGGNNQQPGPGPAKKKKKKLSKKQKRERNERERLQNPM